VSRWQCRERWLDLSQPRIMGVLNVTPDSFSDGGRWLQLQQAVDHAGTMLEQGAHIIDVGGESTRPGAAEVSAEEEIDRVLPVLAALRSAFPAAFISLDTSKAVVLAAAREHIDIINDVRALRETGMLQTAADSGCGICLMHMQGQPRSMQQAPVYSDVINEVAEFLAARVQACMQQGVARKRLVVDPGFGFGKTLAHNTRLLAQLPQLQHELARRQSGELPMLVGISRKSMLAGLLAAYSGTSASSASAAIAPPQRIVAGTVAASVAVMHGASIIRTHDVTPMRDALAVLTALRQPDRDHDNAH